MLVAEALNTDTRVLTAHDSLERTREQMDELHAERLPVIDPSTRELVGLVQRSAIERAEAAGADRSLRLADLELDQPVAIFNNQHLFQAVRLMLQHELSILPVVDSEWICQGVIQKHQVLESLGQMLNLTEYGSVITVELSEQDFSLSEIVQLIETEGGRILGITVEVPTADRRTYEVSIKLNLQDVSRVAASLRRYGYSIVTEVRSESANIDLETRADEFLKYLDM